MNHCVPAWNFEADLPVTNQKKSMGAEHELVELLWQNGQVVLNSQTHRKLNDQPRNGLFENSGHLVQDEETVSWIHNSFEDCFEEELCSSLFNDLPSLDHVHSDKVPLPNHDVTPSQQQPTRAPPPRFQLPGSTRSSFVGFKKITNLPKVPVPTKGGIGASGGSGTLTQGKVRQGSAMSVRSSHCGSNQIQNGPDWSGVGVGHTGLSARPLKENLHKAIQTTEPTLTTSSGGSDSSFGRTCRQSTNFSTDDHKRKRADGEQSPSQSEAAELESAGGCKSSSRQSRRSRAAEVHNLSERRRRDRINEKMKALQELIPHCSKTDKASMLDEAIEYLKSLQLQLQVMWMGGGMAPSLMMFPGVQEYMSQMSMGMASPSLASRVPLTDHFMSVAQTPNQSENYPSLPEQYARYMGFLQMQNATQPLHMNMFKFSSQAMQQSQPMAPPVSNIGPFSCGATTNKLTSG